MRPPKLTLHQVPPKSAIVTPSMGHPIFQDILIIFVLAIPVVLLVHLLRLPSVLGFLATGALIGPFGIGLIQNRHDIDILAELGVALLLFSVGLEFSFETLRKLKHYSFIGGLLQIGGTIVAGFLLGDLLGWDHYRSLYFGCVLSLSSTALVLSSLYAHKMFDSLAGQLSTAILILQDLALIPMIVILPLFAATGAVPRAIGPLLGEAAQSLLILLLVTLAGRLLANKILHQIFSARSRELFVITLLVLVLGMAWITHNLGFFTGDRRLSGWTDDRRHGL